LDDAGAVRGREGISDVDRDPQLRVGRHAAGSILIATVRSSLVSRAR
jgi:hypothetical protein